MNCPHCEKKLPENCSASYCLHCGGELQQPEPIPAATMDRSPLPPIKINWLIFFAVLFAAPLLTMLTAFLSKGQTNESISPAIGFFGGAVAGIACGVMLGLRLGNSVGLRVVSCILFVFIMAAVCIMLSFFGCMVVGYQLRIGG
jgi:hypothetical protein